MCHHEHHCLRPIADIDVDDGDLCRMTLGLGMDLAQKLVLLASASASAIMLLGRIRTRTTTVLGGLGVAVSTALTTIGVVLVGQSSGALQEPESIAVTTTRFAGSMTLLETLVSNAGRQAIYTLLACITMTGLLAGVERIFDVQTDLSLLELGDPSRPLLRQLAQRAPGTYNHSINVAAIAEAAADEIGAHALLTRVGAYYHDIGKMFKPNYFVEISSTAPIANDSLQPAMSTLVIMLTSKTARIWRDNIIFRNPWSISSNSIMARRWSSISTGKPPRRAKKSPPTGKRFQNLTSDIPALVHKLEKRRYSCWLMRWKALAGHLSNLPPARIESLVEQIAMSGYSMVSLTSVV